jgi:FkbM family methyltransferase
VKTIFDIGMYDGADTAYYLDTGHRVVAVDANPDLVEQARARFAAQLASGQLACVNAAVSGTNGPVELYLSRADLGSSSLFGERVANKTPLGSIAVPGVTLPDLFRTYGVPYYMKVDIEGADRLCVLPLTADQRPEFLSFEVDNDVEELVAHLEGIGFRRFKVINQSSFRELDNQNCLYDRTAHFIMRQLGYRDPRLIRRAGRFFVRGHSSGPLPWLSDGRWYDAKSTQQRLREARASNVLKNWYDVHAAAN